MVRQFMDSIFEGLIKAQIGVTLHVIYNDFLLPTHCVLLSYFVLATDRNNHTIAGIIAISITDLETNDENSSSSVDIVGSIYLISFT